MGLIAKALVACLLLLATFVSPLADTLHIACASNFRPTLEKIAAEFTTRTGHELVISSASSGVLFAQINNGAPFQLFFSADAERPGKLVASGKAKPDSLTTYALGRLFLLHQLPNVETPSQVIANAKRIAIANPRTAPYGKAAQTLLDKWQVSADTTILRGNNIAQTWQFFHSGNADTALISASLLNPKQQASAIDVTALLKTPIEQKTVIIKQGNNALANEFLAFIHSHTSQQILLDNGYLIPDTLSQSTRSNNRDNNQPSQ